ncbi:MAG: hypothetical protein RL235_710 [Chlamydiota bacterium]|jgi:predicted enzyme related to lactoylglutathione lyase
MDLVWIVVKDLQKAIDYYTRVVGLKLIEHHPEHNWAEFEAKTGGTRLGIASEQDDYKSGQNAIMTFTVSNLDTAIASFKQQGTRLIGEVIEVPGHVKMQTVSDPDGNQFQLCQMLSS